MCSLIQYISVNFNCKKKTKTKIKQTKTPKTKQNKNKQKSLNKQTHDLVFDPEKSLKFT